MIKKVLISSLILVLFSSKSYSQDSEQGGITNGLTKFVVWITNFDKILSGIDNKETLLKLDRNLGYSSLVIDRIATEKILLAKEIKDLKVDTNDKSHIQSLTNRIDTIVENINELNFYLSEIKSCLSKTNQIEIDSIVLEIDNGFRYRKLYYLKDIKSAIYKQNIPYDKIQKEADESKQIAETALKQIKVAKAKITIALAK